jgi:hypothetical protein
MTANNIIELMNRTPFTPLEIHLSDGASIRVEETFQIATACNSPTCVVYDGDRMRIVVLRNVTEVVTPSSSS